METESIVYIVDPDQDQDMTRSLAALLNMYDIPVSSFDDVESFIAATPPELLHPSCLLLKLENIGTAGEAAISQARAARPQLPIIAIGDDAPKDIGQRARDAGATEFIEKSLASTYLFHRLAELIPGQAGLPSTESSTMEMADGKQVTFRMSHPEDAELFQEFIVALSDRSRYMRFFSGLKQLPQHALKEFTSPRFPQSFAVSAIASDGEQERQIGVARWVPTEEEGIGEFAVVVADDCQGQGIAGRLMRLLITAATLGRLERIEGLILKENVPMLSMVQKMGFDASSNHDAGPSIAMYTKDLSESAA